MPSINAGQLFVRDDSLTKTKNYLCEYGCLGGTFDRLHGGHKLLLETAFRFIKKVLIGITSDELARKGKKFPNLIWSYEKRVEDVMGFLNILHIEKDRIEIKRLSVATQYAAEVPEIEAIVLSPETYGRLLSINDLRRKNNLKEIIAIAIPYYRDEKGKIVSSQTFRELESQLHKQIQLKNKDAKI